MSWILFHNFSLGQENGNAVDLDTDVVKMMFIDNTRTPVQATDSDMTDIDDNEVATGTGYSAGGPTLANASVVLNAGVVKFDSDDVTISQDALTGFADAYFAVLYYSTGVPANDVPIAYAALTGPVGNTSGDLEIQMDASDGIFTKTVS